MSNSYDNSWYATSREEVEIVNAMRTGCNSNDVWLSMDECHIVHMNHGALHWRLRRDGKVIGVGLAPPKVSTPVREAGT